MYTSALYFRGTNCLQYTYRGYQMSVGLILNLLNELKYINEFNKFSYEPPRI